MSHHCTFWIRDVSSKTTLSNDHFDQQHFRQMTISSNNTFVEMAFSSKGHFVDLRLKMSKFNKLFFFQLKKSVYAYSSGRETILTVFTTACLIRPYVKFQNRIEANIRSLPKNLYCKNTRKYIKFSALEFIQSVSDVVSYAHAIIPSYYIQLQSSVPMSKCTCNGKQWHNSPGLNSRIKNCFRQYFLMSNL